MSRYPIIWQHDLQSAVKRIIRYKCRIYWLEKIRTLGRGRIQFGKSFCKKDIGIKCLRQMKNNFWIPSLLFQMVIWSTQIVRRRITEKRSVAKCRLNLIRSSKAAKSKFFFFFSLKVCVWWMKCARPFVAVYLVSIGNCR